MSSVLVRHFPGLERPLGQDLKRGPMAEIYSIGYGPGRKSYPGAYSRAYLLDGGEEERLILIDTLSDADVHLVLKPPRWRGPTGGVR